VPFSGLRFVQKPVMLPGLTSFAGNVNGGMIGQRTTGKGKAGRGVNAAGDSFLGRIDRNAVNVVGSGTRP